MSKATYLARCIQSRMSCSDLGCRNCGHPQSVVIDRKYLVTELRRCSHCLMMYRAPSDPPQHNATYYNQGYRQGYTTDLPSEVELTALIKGQFRGTGMDYSYYIGVLAALGAPRGARVFDYGCSWGYGTYQMKTAGFDVVGYEISRSRGDYAAHMLGLDVVADFSQWSERPDTAATFDVFFSAHVLEHVPSPGAIFAAAERVLKPGGLFVGFCPNGSAAHRAAASDWHRRWGEVHPNYLDDVFLNRLLMKWPHALGTSAVVIDARLGDLLRTTNVPVTLFLDPLEREELFFVAKKPWAAE